MMFRVAKFQQQKYTPKQDISTQAKPNHKHIHTHTQQQTAKMFQTLQGGNGIASLHSGFPKP